MLRLARSRLLPCGSCLATVDAVRLFSSQTEDGDNKEKDDNSSLYSGAAWKTTIKPAYLAFLARNKHLMVPTQFVVPSGDDAWPDAAWGYALGKHAEWLRKQWREGGEEIKPTLRRELEEMQFAWDLIQYNWDRCVLPALRRFYELNGNTDVPGAFRIPTGDPRWPERLWGQKLGQNVTCIRCLGQFAEQVRANAEELERIKFCHDSTLSDRDWCVKVIPALKVFRQEFGHCDVGCNFRVPSCSPWPEAAWNMRLGKTVNSIRSGRRGADQDLRVLNDLGFVWNHVEEEWSVRILPALEGFREIEGHCRVPKGFVVPSSKPWPVQTWGLKLGVVVSNMRGAECYYSAQASRDKHRLKELGFVWNILEAQWNDRILPALKTYFQENGHCRVPQPFVVPSESVWPVEAHGFNLGFSVASIRHHGCYFDYTSRSVDTLQAIGFKPKIRDRKWRARVEPLLATFEQLHGDRNVPRDFVVPSEDPWREKDWGIQLGKLEPKKPLQEA